MCCNRALAVLWQIKLNLISIYVRQTKHTRKESDTRTHTHTQQTDRQHAGDGGSGGHCKRQLVAQIIKFAYGATETGQNSRDHHNKYLKSTTGRCR